MVDITNQQLLTIMRQEFATKEDIAELRSEQLLQSVALDEMHDTMSAYIAGSLRA